MDVSLNHGDDLPKESLSETNWNDFKEPIIGTLIPNFFITYFGQDLPHGLAGKVRCWRVETRVKMTDMCLSGQHIADMLADMLATRHKKLSTGVPGRHVTACCLLTCRQYVGNMTNI